MAAQNPPVNGVAHTAYIALQDFANPGAYKANPTLAAGDVKVSIDGGAFNNLTTLPTVTPAAGIAVKVALSASEMTGDNIFVQFIDQTSPKEWADYAFNIQTVAAGWATASNVSAVETDTQDIQARLPAALVSGRMDSNVQAMADNVVTAAKIADGAIDAATFAAGAITAAAIAPDAIGASELAADAVAEIQSGLSTLTAAGVRAAVGLASANLDTQLDALPTNAELATALGTADDAVLAAIAALNDLSSAGAQAAAAAALAAYGAATTGDVPTAAENADKLLGRSLATGADGGRTVQDALRVLRNKRSIAAGTLTVTAEDDATPAWTAAVTTAAGNPVDSIDPA